MVVTSSLAYFQNHWQLTPHFIMKNTFKTFSFIATPLKNPWPPWFFSILYRSTGSKEFSINASILNSVVLSRSINPLNLHGISQISLLLWFFSSADYVYSLGKRLDDINITLFKKNLSDNLGKINWTNYMLPPLGTPQIIRKTINFPSLEQNEE